MGGTVLSLNPAGTCIEAGVAFLLRARQESGWWRDWETQAGISDEWVTAYTACVLAASGDPEARAAAVEAFELLCSRRPSRDGWAYNENVPPDADSTLCVCRLAHCLNRLPTIGASFSFLESCFEPGGGLATYASKEGVLRSMHLKPSASFRGWLAPHTCVTAAAAALPEFGSRSNVRAYLRRKQDPDGHWDGYWWPDPEYTTALAVEALRQHGTTEDLPAVKAAVRWAQALPDDTAAFATACRIRILAGDDPQTCRELASTLGELQNDDGSWPSSARIQIPPPDFMDPSSIWNWDYERKDFYCIRLDQCRIFTTATVVGALQSLL